MFAGVGCFSLIIANHSRAQKIFSIDINPIAVKYMKYNITANRVYGRVVPILGDAKEVIKKRLVNMADRVLMPLPKKAFDYLSYAHTALRETGGWIHYYDFEHAKKNENPIEKVKHKVAKKLENLAVGYQISYGRVVRTTGPNWYQVVLDIQTKL
jgi:tRNA (guanine37-N1)-methyltransferase